MHTLRTFECVCRLGSFTGAAEELHITISAVSHQIKALETFYGIKLLRRNHRDVSLTHAGESLLSVVAGFLDKLSAVGRSLRSSHANRLSLSAPPSFVSRWLMPRLGTFLGAHPDVDFTLHATTELVDLDLEDVDVAIRYGRGDWAGLSCEKLFDEEVFPVGAPTYVAGSGIRDLKDLSCALLLRDDFCSWDDWLRQTGVFAEIKTPGPVYSESSLLIQAVEAGQGVALGRSTLVDDALAAGTLVRIGVQSLKTADSYYLVHSTAAPMTSAAGAFREWLMAAIASSASTCK